MNLFYVHSSETLKNISFIEEFIQNESLTNRSIKKQNKKTPNFQVIYGVYVKNKYCRVRLLSRVRVVVPASSLGLNNEENELFLAFYIGK